MSGVDFTLSGAAEAFGVGTTVACYVGTRPPVSGGRPPGKLVATGVVAANGSLTLKGLRPNVDHIAYAAGRHIHFLTPA